jgi:hypothetical protein
MLSLFTAWIFKNQQNALIEIKKRTQKALQIRCQLLHVAAPKCQQQAMYHQQRCADPTRNSGAIRLLFPRGLHYNIPQLMTASYISLKIKKLTLKYKHPTKVPIYWQFDHKLLPRIMIPITVQYQLFS